MKSSHICLTACFILLLASGHILSAKSLHPPTVAQTAPMTKREQQNLSFVLNFWREVLEAGHLELSTKYQAEDYIQHNPNVPTGRTGFLAYFSRDNQPVNPIPAALQNPPKVMGAKGDFVWMMFEFQKPNPNDSSKTYRYDHFDLLRLQNGKIQEHWDSAAKQPGAGSISPGISPRQPSQWNTGTLSRTEHQTLAVATQYIKDVMQYGYPELIARIVDANYIEHDPNITNGPEGLKHFVMQSASQRPGKTGAIQAEWPEPPALTLVNGPYCIMMWQRTEKDPDDSHKSYQRSFFELVRVEGGRVKEHWDQERIIPSQSSTSK